MTRASLKFALGTMSLSNDVSFLSHSYAEYELEFATCRMKEPRKGRAGWGLIYYTKEKLDYGIIKHDLQLLLCNASTTTITSETSKCSLFPLVDQYYRQTNSRKSSPDFQS
jgi:hypothetical protein